MGAPKIKIYQLPRGYTETGDSDIQSAINDEILPFKEKDPSLSNAKPLTGVGLSEYVGFRIEDLTPTVAELLIPDGGIFQTTSGGATDILPSGAFAPVLYTSIDQTTVIPPSGYTVTPSGVLFSSEPAPTGAYISFWRTGESRSYGFEYDGWYDGINPSFSAEITNDGVLINRNEYDINFTTGCVTFKEEATRGEIKAKYYYNKPLSNLFISENENWVPPNKENEGCGHLYLGPDVFVGTYDYPGDYVGGSLNSGGIVPKFVESGTYQIDYRKGSVTFGSEASSNLINSEINPVCANYAHLTMIENVSNQGLSPAGFANDRYIYKCESDHNHPGSIDARWVNKNTQYMPTNIYKDGVISPKVVSMIDIDSLTVKTGE